MRLTPITVADLSSSKTEDEAALKAEACQSGVRDRQNRLLVTVRAMSAKAAADAPQKITDARQKAAALVKAR